MSLSVVFRVDFPSQFATATLKKDSTVEELKATAKKTLKIDDLAHHSVSAVSYLHDVIVLDGKNESKLDELGLQDESVIYFLAPENAKPKLKRKNKKEVKEEETISDPEERYKGFTVDNALTKLQAARKPLDRTIALEYIDMFAGKILAHPEKMKLDLLKLILKSDTLNLPEGEILDVVLKWGNAELKRTKKESKELKSVLETSGLLYLVRLPCMDMGDVAAKITTSGLLGDTQLLDLYTYLSAKAVPGAKVALPASLKAFNAKPRDPREDRDTSWMETTDSFKGFKPIPSPSGVTRFWLAVSKSSIFDSKARYDPPRGYEWATSEMWNSSTVLSSNSDYNYYNQGGWSGYTWAGQTRYYFAFKDILTSNRAIHAGNYATMSSYTTWNPTSSPSNFAGTVVIKTGSWDPVSRTFKA